MRQFLTIMATASGLSLALSGTAALAGSCGQGINSNYCQPPQIAPPASPCGVVTPPALPASNCQTSVIVRSGAHTVQDPIIIGSTAPMGYLRSVKFHGAPQVNIMRVHGQATLIGIKDAPTGFTAGCNPTSTTYCGQQTDAPAAKPTPQPYIAPPVAPSAPQPVAVQPMVISAPRPALINPALLQPRQYGTTGMVRGTAYLPTSHVNRDYQTAHAVLNAGTIPARPAVNGGQVPHPSMFGNSHYMTSAVSSASPVYAPQPEHIIAPYPVEMGPGPVPNGGPSYWKKVSGPTMVGGLAATQVVCRHSAPAPQMPSPSPAPVTCTRQAMAEPSFRNNISNHAAGGSRYGASGH